MCCPPSDCTATTPPSPCWRGARPSPAGSGPMSVTTGPLADRRLRPRCSATRGTERPSLRTGILQADAYAGYNALYEADRIPRPIIEAGCWANSRRKLFELAEVARAPLAIEAVRRIDAIFDAERAINGLPADKRLAMRQQHIAPLVTELEAWMRESRGKLSRHNPVAKAMDYMLTRWEA